MSRSPKYSDNINYPKIDGIGISTKYFSNPGNILVALELGDLLLSPRLCFYWGTAPDPEVFKGIVKLSKLL